MSAIRSLHELLIEQVRSLYHAETELVRALPKMARAAGNPELKTAFRQHGKQTKLQVLRLKHVGRLLGSASTGKACHGILGLVREGNDAIRAAGIEAVRDANLIGIAQQMKHHEMAAYGTARAFALKLAELEVAALLQESLEEERAADRVLTSISMRVNDEAANCGDDDASVSSAIRTPLKSEKRSADLGVARLARAHG